MAYDYDLFVIGAGSGGVRASRVSAGYGARVAIAEEYRLGGTCVVRGCVPKKLFVYGAHFHETFEQAASFGWQLPEGEIAFNWHILRDNKDKEIARLEGFYGRMLEQSGVKIYPSRATFLDAHTLQLGNETVSADKILIATGSRPVMPETPGIEHAISSNEAFHLPDFPNRVAVVGSGYIAVEFAGIFNGLGAETTLIYRSPMILKSFDRDIRTHLAGQMAEKGIVLRHSTKVSAIEKLTSGEKRLTLSDGTALVVDEVMYATGRRANTDHLGLETVGVKTAQNGAVIVDDDHQTCVDTIYAVGDVTDRVQLTPVAIKEGTAFADSVFGGRPWTMNWQAIPTAVFSQPSVGTVGLTEQDARARGYDVAIYRSVFRQLKHTLTPSGEKTMMKLIVDKKTDTVLGAHMVGPEAGEIIQGIGIAVKMGATKAQFDQTVAIHPSAAEEFVTMRLPVTE